MQYPLISPIPAVQAHYQSMRAEGTAHTLAEMFALQQGPALMTDDVFNQGRGGSHDQWGKGQGWIGDRYAKEAKRQGVDITGRTYLHQLADRPGDPKAWVSSRGDVQRVCEERGWGCSGAVNVKAREPLDDPRRPIAVADDIVAAATRDAVARDPGLALRDPGEVKHEITEKIRPHWTRKKLPRQQPDLRS